MDGSGKIRRQAEFRFFQWSDYFESGWKADEPNRMQTQKNIILAKTKTSSSGFTIM